MPLMDISNNDLTSAPTATGGRRKSGRAVKVPEKFIPDAPSSQPGQTSAKRKREQENGENDASGLEDEADEDEISEESAAEEEIRASQRRPNRARKPATKKAKVNGRASHTGAPAVKLPSRPKKSRRVAIADNDADGLYAEVFTSGDNLADVASQWLTRYQADGPEAMTDFVNFVLKCCGCDLQVTTVDIDDPDNAGAKLADLQDDFQAQNIADYPLISRAKSAHAFRQSLTGFIENLANVMHDSGIMYEDPAFMQNFHSWVVSMTSSTSRPFRHTSTLIALTMSTSMCKIAKKQTEQAAKIQRQLEGEQKKKGSNKARLEEFKRKAAGNEQNRAFIESEIQEFFNSVYLHRYKDVDTKIRLENVEAMGDWIITLDSVFYEAEYLRYMGWMLSDASAPMRQEVLRQLARIMRTLNTGVMRHFIERFRVRMVEIAARDSDPGVRAAAIDLIGLIREAEMLEPDDIDTIGKLIFDTEPRVRKAVVPFFSDNIKDLYEGLVEDMGGKDALEDMLSAVDEEDFDSPRISWISYKCLGECLRVYDELDQEENPSQVDITDSLSTSIIESRFTLAAQALYDKLPDLNNWDMLAGYLLYDHTANLSGVDETERALRNNFQPNDKEELILLEVLNAVVKISLTQSDDSDKGRRKPSKADTAEAKDSAARRLAGLIPRLLKKYGADPKTATVVLRLEHVLNLGVFQELRQDSTVYARLLDEISAQFNGHADRNVLTEASAALLHARSYEELEEVTELKMQSLWEDSTNTLRKLSQAGELSLRGGLRIKVLRELSQNVARLQQLASISDCVESFEAEDENRAQNPITILIDIVARGQFYESNEEIDVIEDEIVESAVRSVMFYFMWKSRALLAAVEAGDEIVDIDIDQLKDLQDSFISNLVAAFSSRATLDPVRLLGAGSFLDLHVLFATLRPAKKSKGKGADVDSDPCEHLQTLLLEITPMVQQELTSIFDAAERDFAKKSNPRKTLAEPGEDEAPEDLDSDDEDDEDQDATDVERYTNALKAEQKLCEFTGKLVLAIIAQVIDASGPLKGKLRTRIQRNVKALGHNFKEIVAYLDEPKLKEKKSHKSKALQAADAKKAAAKSAETVEEDEEDEPFVEVEPEEGTAEDLRRRELLDEDAAGSPEAEVDADDAEAEEEEDDIMGD